MDVRVDVGVGVGVGVVGVSGFGWVWMWVLLRECCCMGESNNISMAQSNDNMTAASKMTI